MHCPTATVYSPFREWHAVVAQRMRVSIDKLGGVAGTVQRRRSGTSSLKEAAALAASLAAANARAGDDSSRATLRYMPARGNPFAPVSSHADDERASLGGDSDDSDEVVDEDAADMEDDDEDAQGPGNRSQRRQDRFGSQWVVTLAALNGFAPAVGELAAVVGGSCRTIPRRVRP